MRSASAHGPAPGGSLLRAVWRRGIASPCSTPSAVSGRCAEAQCRPGLGDELASAWHSWTLFCWRRVPARGDHVEAPYGEVEKLLLGENPRSGRARRRRSRCRPRRQAPDRCRWPSGSGRRSSRCRRSAGAARRAGGPVAVGVEDGGVHPSRAHDAHADRQPDHLHHVVEVLADRHDGVLACVVRGGPGMSPAIDAVLTMWPPRSMRMGRNARHP